MKTNILFVCLGNICRSPAAEGIMKKFLEKSDRANDFCIDSAGLLDYHEGNPADHRMIKAAAERGYTLDTPSRPIKDSNFKKFDYIVAMDPSVVLSLQRMAGSEVERKKIYLMSDFLTQHNYNEIPDPYYGDKKDFELVLDLLEDAIQSFTKKILDLES